MIFVRCRDGISHNPAEYSRPEDCAAGARVLLGAYLRYDDYVRKQHAVDTADSSSNSIEHNLSQIQLKA
jgi:hypothetical protein